MLCHIIHNSLDSDVDCVFNDSLVEISNYVLNHAEELKQFPTSIKYFVRKHILLSVYPQVRESFLSRIQNLSQVA